MVRGIRGRRLLEGYRGHTPVDFPAIEEIDLNPVFAYDRDTPSVAVDARLRVMPQ